MRRRVTLWMGISLVTLAGIIGVYLGVAGVSRDTSADTPSAANATTAAGPSTTPAVDEVSASLESQQTTSTLGVLLVSDGTERPLRLREPIYPDTLKEGEYRILGDRLPADAPKVRMVIKPRYGPDADPNEIMPALFLDPQEVALYRELCLKGVTFYLENGTDGYLHIVDVQSEAREAAR